MEKQADSQVGREPDKQVNLDMGVLLVVGIERTGYRKYYTRLGARKRACDLDWFAILRLNHYETSLMKYVEISL